MAYCDSEKRVKLNTYKPFEMRRARSESAFILFDNKI